MKPYRALLPLLSSLILCIVVWTSDVHALSVTVQARTPDANNTVLTTGTVNFTSSGTTLPGCISGYVCNTVTGWSGGSGGSLSFGGGTTSTLDDIRITTNAGYTSGPTSSVYDPGSSIAFALNGFIFQGFSTGTGRLQITLTHTFPNLTDGTRTYGFMESGNFLQPTVGSSTGNVSGDTLTMQGQVDTLAVFPDPALVKTAGTGETFAYSFNLSPTASRLTDKSGGTVLKYTWVYNYNNTGGPVTSKFSDPPPFPPPKGPCPPPAKADKCDTTGGLGVYLASAEDLPGILQTLSTATGVSNTGVPIPEPSSVLLLGLGLLSGGFFFASRLRKERERETR